MCCDKLEHDTQFLRQFMTRTNTLLPAACIEFGWCFFLPPPPPWELQAPPWELRNILLTPKHRSSSSGWNSRTSCWCFLLPWGLVLDMSLQHFSILFLAPGCSCLCCKAHRLGWDGMVTAGWGSTEAPTAAEVAKCCCNTNKDPVLGCCLKLMGWRGTKGLSKGFGEALGQPLPIVDASFSICKSRGWDADFMWKRLGTSLKAKC